MCRLLISEEVTLYLKSMLVSSTGGKACTYDEGCYPCVGLCDVSNCFFPKFQAFWVWLRYDRLIYKQPSNETFSAIHALAMGTAETRSQSLLLVFGNDG